MEQDSKEPVCRRAACTRKGRYRRRGSWRSGIDAAAPLLANGGRRLQGRSLVGGWVPQPDLRLTSSALGDERNARGLKGAADSTQIGRHHADRPVLRLGASDR